MTNNQEKALKCKWFDYSPLGTAAYCKRPFHFKELKSVVHNIEWDDSKCPCKHWKERNNS